MKFLDELEVHCKWVGINSLFDLLYIEWYFDCRIYIIRTYCINNNTFTILVLYLYLYSSKNEST
jgi:hypothetical protein